MSPGVSGASGVSLSRKTLIYRLINAIIRYMKILEQLEKFRLKNRISQQALALKLGVHFTTVNRWFRGHQKPNKMQEYQIRELLRKGGK